MVIDYQMSKIGEETQLDSKCCQTSDLKQLLFTRTASQEIL